MVLREVDLQPRHEPSAGRVHAATQDVDGAQAIPRVLAMCGRQRSWHRKQLASSATSQFDSELLPVGTRQPDRRRSSLMRRPVLAFLGMACLEPLAAETVDDDCVLAAASARGKVYHGRGLHPHAVFGVRQRRGV